jgi:NAD-dependent deacetylase
MVQPNEQQNTLIQKASQLIHEATYPVALTGAGISTPSGIPDFRSPGSGIWTKYSPMEVASLSAFRYHPQRFYEWIRPFVKNLFQAAPNPAHHALARLEEGNRLRSVITQNIDALHQKAGSNQVLEVHGTFQTLTCLGCYRQIQATDQLFRDFIEEEKNPHCPYCDNLLKPDIILYEEQLPVQTWKKVRNEINQCDLMLVLGSSLTVTPVCDLPLTALGKGAKLIIVNQANTHLDHLANVFLQGDLEELLPLIADKVLNDNEKK